MKPCLSLLLLLLGLCQAQPLVGEESEADVLEDNEDMDIITDIRISNNDSNEILLEGDLSKAQPLVGEESVDDVLEDNEDMDISTRILISNNGSNEILLEGDLLLPTTRNAMKAYTSAERSQIVSAMQSFHRTTCIRFVPRQNQKDHISVQSGGGCYSSLGRTGGMQVLSLRRSGCMYYGIMQHEVYHALGFNHEQTRSDRDQYVKINWKNINPSNAYNFERQNTNNLNTPYDYTSIMHYGRTAFSINGRDSITPIPNSRVQIGQRKGMTRDDFLRINRLYRC
ncbi:unnamed protein product [Arctogadus glacialis]